MLIGEKAPASLDSIPIRSLRIHQRLQQGRHKPIYTKLEEFEKIKLRQRVLGEKSKKPYELLSAWSAESHRRSQNNRLIVFKSSLAIVGTGFTRNSVGKGLGHSFESSS